MNDRARQVGDTDPLALGGLLEQAVNNLWLGIILFNQSREVVYCNQRYMDMYGLAPEQVRPGTPVSDLIQHRLKLGLKIRGEADAYVRARTEGTIVSERTVQEFADGRIIAYAVDRLPNGGGMATHEDITEREELSARLRQRNMQFDIAINNMSHGLCFFDADHRLIVCNRDFIDMYGLPPERVRPGTPLTDIVDMRFAAGSVPAMTRDEYMRWRTGVVVSAEPVDSVIEMRNGRTFKVRHRPMPDLGWVATHEDITEQRQAELKIAHMAHHDALTDLANRALLDQRLAQAFASNQTFAVHHIDLDKFKSVNDTLGHHAGDALLRGVSERLRRLVRPSDTIARMGGDEFIVLQTPIGEAGEPGSLAQRIIERMTVPFDIDDGQTIAGASIGIAVAPADGTTPEQLLRNADLALYRAKSDGRGTYRLFEPAMDQSRRALEIDLRKALAGGEFELHYQPLVKSESGEISGFEALIRWQHPQHGLIAPNSFIPLAEETGLIVPIGEWVIRQACRTASRWPKHLHVAVNISAAQFRYAGLAEVIVSALATAGLEASRLEIEITESVLLQDKEGTLAILHRLREFGVGIALDDFGTGYSSLTYLQCFPFDKIKIDRSFVRDVATDAGSLNIVRAITALASGMGMTATAEGVETREQLDRIAAEGCTEMQGYLFSRPLPASEIERHFLSLEVPALRDRFAAA